MSWNEDRPLHALLKDFALFLHEPTVVAHQSGLPSAQCSCGWGTLPIPSPFQYAVWDALDWHQREVNEAIEWWEVSRREQGRLLVDEAEAWMQRGR